MANMCYFEMHVKGAHENVEKFYNAMSQKGTIWMGRGAEADIRQLQINNDVYEISGYCKWSIDAALITNAVSMRTNPERWHALDTSYEYITLWEACERWNLKMEAYSAEPGACFQEHLIYDGTSYVNEDVDWYEYYLEDFATKEEAENELETTITDEEWQRREHISRGGYAVSGEWQFSI